MQSGHHSKFYFTPVLSQWIENQRMAEQKVDGISSDKKARTDASLLDMTELVEKQKSGNYRCGQLSYQVPFLAQLAAYYHKNALEAGHNENNWTNFLRAQALYNSCQVKCADDQERTTYKAYADTVELDYMRSVQFSPEQIAKYNTLTAPRPCLNRLREELREKVRMIALMEEGYDIHDLSAAGNQSIETEMIKSVKELSKRSTEGMKDIFRQIISKVESVVGEPPCAYDVIGCGSMARDEMTPYSDLEYFIIVDKVTSEAINYFKTLSILTYFIISNVGETNLHYMCIEELEKAGFKDDGPSGLKIDGLAPKAGNIPTGNGLPGSRILIDSAENLVAMYEDEMLAPSQADKGINGNLSDLLATTCLIYRHDGETSPSEESLYDQYNRLKQATDVKVLQPGSDQLNSKVQLFVDDIKKHDFLPIPEDQWSGQTAHKTKQAIYRYPTILLNDLKIILQQHDVLSPWDMIDRLERDEVLNECNAHSFRLLVAIAIYTRIAVYLHYNSQREDISFLKQRADEVSENCIERYHMSQKWFIAMASIIIPVKLALKEDVDKINSVDVIKESLQKLTFRKNDGSVKTLAYNYQGDHRSCQSEIGGLLESCKTFSALQKHLAELLEERYSLRLLQIYGASLMRDGLYEQANAVFEFLVDLVKLDADRKNAALSTLAVCYYLQGKYTASLHIFQESLELTRSKLSKLSPSETALYVEMESMLLNNIARVLTKLGRYEQALVNHAESKKLHEQSGIMTQEDSNLGTHTFNMANLYQELGNSQLAVTTQREALRIREKIYGRSSTHSHIASSHDCLGRSLMFTDPEANKDEALAHLTKALNMRKKLYDDGSDKKAHTALAFSYDHLGEYYIFMKQPAAAIENLMKAIHMRESVLGTKHIDLAMSYANLGDAYEMSESTPQAIEAYKKAMEALPDGDRDERKCEKVLDKYGKSLARYES